MVEKKYNDSSREPSEEIILDEEKVSEIFNNFFVNFVPTLKMPTNHNCNMDFQKTDDPVLNAINKYKYHSSTVIIKSKMSLKVCFVLHQYSMKIFLEKLKI